MHATILVVEDDAVLRDVLHRALVEDGYQVQSAANGKIALEIHAHEPVDLIVSDVRMPELDGHGLVAHLRQHRDPTPIILMSANDVPVPLRDAVPYLQKPFDLDRLFEMIEAFLEIPQ